VTKTTSVKLLCGALLATMVVAETPASADPTDITVIGDWFRSNGTFYSGINGVHTFGGPVTTIPGTSPTFTVDVSSGPSQRPGWTYELTIDFYDFALFNLGGDGGSFWQFTFNIKDEPTGNPISEYEVKNGAGIVLAVADLGSTDGTITFQLLNSAFDLPGASQDKLTIQWNQIPAPGALALLGVAGLVGKRRRRN
jgi:hypothetical protein